jgi:hypothetical protein
MIAPVVLVDLDYRRKRDDGQVLVMKGWDVRVGGKLGPFSITPFIRGTGMARCESPAPGGKYQCSRAYAHDDLHMAIGETWRVYAVWGERYVTWLVEE